MSPDSSQKIIRIQVQECTQSQQHHSQQQPMHHQQLPPHVAMQQSTFMGGQVQGQVHKFQIHQPPQQHILKIKSDNVVGPKIMMRPPTPNDYHAKNPPVMDTTVASSGEPDLNIGKASCQLSLRVQCAALHQPFLLSIRFHFVKKIEFFRTN
jgi:hypothetical protein